MKEMKNQMTKELVDYMDGILSISVIRIDIEIENEFLLVI